MMRAPCSRGCSSEAKKSSAKIYRMFLAYLKAGDFPGALGYYHDALAACPGNARAELNLGRAYEALNDKGQALAHYQSAASSTDPGESAAETEAHHAIGHLGGSSQ